MDRLAAVLVLAPQDCFARPNLLEGVSTGRVRPAPTALAAMQPMPELADGIILARFK